MSTRTFRLGLATTSSASTFLPIHDVSNEESKPKREVDIGFFGSRDLFHAFVDAIHRLKAKDGEPKHSLRKEAFPVASTVGQCAGKRMAQRWQPAVPRTPSNEAELADGYPVAWRQPQPDAINSDELYHRLRFLDDAAVLEHLKEKRRVELEKKYDDLAVEAELEWKGVKGSAK